MSRYEQHQANAMCDLINFVLKCTGCDLQVDLHDIEDPDNASNKLTDLQDEYHSLKITDYPLISRTKKNVSFRATMTGFFHALISTAHAAGVLYSDEALIENIQVWVTSMSSSAIRPFRHTATVISLSICNTMCSLAAELAENVARMMRQKASEQKKKTVNKARVADLEAKIAEGERKRVAAVNIVNDIYDTIYVNRYRDVDPKIRVECVAALGTWITTLPDTFFSGQYLRYLGWVLSDTSAPTRAEVIKQLCRMFKNKENASRLRAFTERFRPRLVEMATRDAEPNIRAATVELLDMIRGTGLLEPDDIDVIGKLIFDSELRVRKAVAKFFGESINDLFESAVEDLGGAESLEEVLGEEVEGDYEAPRLAWLKLACLAEVLQSYDDSDDDQRVSQQMVVVESLEAGDGESRFSLAAQAIYQGVPEVQDWRVIAGYLLCDLSSLPTNVTDAERAFKERCQLNEDQEALLLHVLNTAVRSRLGQAKESGTDKKGKKSKTRVQESHDTQESTAIHLAQILPLLLRKFGSEPATASAVLRLEHVLNLGIFQELRQDATNYSELLDDIKRQFLEHVDQTVLAEASSSLLHARSFEGLEEITERKLRDVWHDTIRRLRSVQLQPDTEDYLTNVCPTVRRIANLASISDCVSHLHWTPPSDPKMGSLPVGDTHSILLTILETYQVNEGFGSNRGGEPEEVSELIVNAIKALLFYYMWHVRSLQAAVENSTPLPDVEKGDEFRSALVAIMESRLGSDPVRFAAAGTYLDLYTLFATFRNIDYIDNNASDEPFDIKSLAEHIPLSTQSLVLSIYTAAEKHFARKSHRTLEPVPNDNVDVDSEPKDSEDDEDDDDEDDGAAPRARAAKLLAEKQLCELAGKMVLATVGHVLDHRPPDDGQVRTRLARNKLRLGQNFKETVAFLEGKKAVTGTKGEKRNVKKKKKGKSEEIIEEEEDEDEDENDEVVVEDEEEGGEEDLRIRELDAEAEEVDDTRQAAAGAEDAADESSLLGD